MTPLQIILAILGSVITFIAGILATSKIFIELFYKPRLDDLASQLDKEKAYSRELEIETANQRQEIDKIKISASAQSRQLETEAANLRQEIEKLKINISKTSDKKAEIDRRLDYTMTTLNAEAGSIIVPEPSRISTNFVFLSSLGPVADKLKYNRFALTKGIAGYVYAKGELLNSRDVNEDSRWLQLIDEISKYNTQSLVCAPITLNGITLGVVQFLNKKDGLPFDQEDEKIVINFSSRIALSVEDFIQNYENFQQIGITPERNEKEATIVFFDMTASKLLFKFLETSAAIDKINEYIERHCEVSIRYGGIIDKYLGDGGMIRFMDAHIEDVIKASIEMKNEFVQMKNAWVKFDNRLDNIYTRIGLSHGSVRETIMGHPQFKQITVMGDVVNKASLLCEISSRNKNVILIDKISLDAINAPISTARYTVERDFQYLKDLPDTYEILND